MGALLGRFRKKISNKDVLEQITRDIKSTETSRLRAEYLRSRTIIYLILLSFVFYLLAALFYFYHFPKDLPERLIFVMPLIVFPLVIHVVKKVLHYVFVQRINRNELKLRELYEKKTKVLDKVKENETYKVAQEILEKYDPDYIKAQQQAKRQSREQKEGTELRQRRVESPHVGQRPRLQPHPVTTPTPQPVSSSPLVHQVQHVQYQPMVQRTPEIPPQQMELTGRERGVAKDNGVVRRLEGSDMHLPQQQIVHLLPGYVSRPAPGPPVQCPILPRERTAVDKVVEYLVGDGPNNRFALICKQCHSHNGMALPDEFEYLSFRCAYCYVMNPAHKQKPNLTTETSTPAHPASPTAPTTQTTPTTQTIRTTPTTQTQTNTNTNDDDTQDTNNREPQQQDVNNEHDASNVPQQSDTQEDKPDE
ncbi:endoplasmic reticulum junction formation protein lunapark-B-like [Corticium candelabrum]|uniref:endoplasmic reticulum junction formation protein lunapark-B-like n=1 Tax=Corticium candelabrum TaxID=121492 RepID=UPI002E27085D|nr:endoplasmic reticulum junction formation protein lunapark-B-like [Corticium candelabrum]